LVSQSREDAAGVTRQRLLDTALALFADAGPDGVTMKQVALQAGVTHGALYWHFRNKQDLLNQLYQQTELPFERHYLEQRQAVQQDALGALENYVRGSLSELVRQPQARQVYRLFHYGRARSRELASLQKLLDAEVESWRQSLRFFLKQARKQKQLRKKLDLDQLALSLLTGLIGALDLWISAPALCDLETQADYLLAIQLEGLRNLKPSMV